MARRLPRFTRPVILRLPSDFKSNEYRERWLGGADFEPHEETE